MPHTNRKNHIPGKKPEPENGSGKSGSISSQPDKGLNDSRNQVVNEEDQNRPVNASDQNFKEENDSTVKDEAGMSGIENVTPETSKDIETPVRTEGDDLNIKEGKIPVN